MERVGFGKSWKELARKNPARIPQESRKDPARIPQGSRKDPASLAGIFVLVRIPCKIVVRCFMCSCWSFACFLFDFLPKLFPLRRALISPTFPRPIHKAEDSKPCLSGEPNDDAKTTTKGDNNRATAKNNDQGQRRKSAGKGVHTKTQHRATTRYHDHGWSLDLIKKV